MCTIEDYHIVCDIFTDDLKALGFAISTLKEISEPIVDDLESGDFEKYGKEILQLLEMPQNDVMSLVKHCKVYSSINLHDLNNSMRFIALNFCKSEYSREIVRQNKAVINDIAVHAEMLNRMSKNVNVEKRAHALNYNKTRQEVTGCLI